MMAFKIIIEYRVPERIQMSAQIGLKKVFELCPQAVCQTTAEANGEHECGHSQAEARKALTLALNQRSLLDKSEGYF